MDDFGILDCGTNIKRVRLKHKLTQAQFGEIIGKSASTLHAYENNTVTPPFEVIKTISEIFGIPVGTLMGLEDLKVRKESMTAVRERLNLGTDDVDLSEEQLKAIYTLFIGKTGACDE